MLSADIPASIECFQYFGEAIDKIEGAVTNTADDAIHYILRQPLVVTVDTVPWNFPLMIPFWKVAPALAAGNSVVLKLAEQSPLSCGLRARLSSRPAARPGFSTLLRATVARLVRRWLCTAMSQKSASWAPSRSANRC